MSSNLLEEARAKVGTFCLNHCDALCCRKGSLPLTETNKEIVLKGAVNSIINRLDNGMISLELSKGGCPQLKGNSCGIYDNPEKPKPCSQFPLMEIGKTIIPIRWCPAVKENFFEEYFEKLEAEGYNILK